jgi:hypothetical protein
MSIAFVKVVTPWSAASPAASGSFTPGGAGNTLLAVGIDFSTTGATLTFSGASSYTTPATNPNGLGGFGQSSPTNAWTANVQQPNNFANYNGEAVALGYSLSCAAGSQTCSVTSSNGAGDTCMGNLAEYSGVGYVTYGYGVLNTPASPFTTLQIGVPTNSVLVCLCVASNNTAITNNNGTSRGSGTTWNGSAYIWTEFTGANALVTPSFSSTASGSATMDIYYFLLTPTGGIPPKEVVQTAIGTEAAATSWTVAATSSIPINDVAIIIVSGGGAGGGSNPIPCTCADSLSGGSAGWTSVNPVWNSGFQFFGQIFFKKMTVAGTPTFTVTSSGATQTAFAALVHSTKWIGTPTTDAGASVTASGTSATQGGNVSTSFPGEVLALAEWSTGFPTPDPTGWIHCGGSNDSEFFGVPIANIANNFAGSLGSSINWLSVFAGIYDSIASASPAGAILLGQILT